MVSVKLIELFKHSFLFDSLKFLRVWCTCEKCLSCSMFVLAGIHARIMQSLGVEQLLFFVGKMFLLHVCIRFHGVVIAKFNFQRYQHRPQTVQVNQLNQNTLTTTLPSPAQHAQHGQIPRPNTAQRAQQSQICAQPGPARPPACPVSSHFFSKIEPHR